MLVSLLNLPLAFAGTGYKVKVNGMVCASCAKAIEKKLKSQEEVESVKVSLENKEVVVNFRAERTLSQERITQLLKEAGYEATGFTNLN
jgi:mercuric ion binding protein